MIGEDVLAGLPKCRGLVRYGIGYDVFDVDAATRRGIPVCNIPNYCIPEVASHTMALILGASRQLVHSTLGIRQGLWNQAPGRLTMHRFTSQTLGLLGFGHIAQEVAAYAKPFGFTVLAYDPYMPAAVFEKCGVRSATLDEVVAQSDILSCHTLLNDETRHMLNRERFAQMKDGVIIVNTSRAGVIDEAALIEALRSGKVAAAGLDVVEQDVMPPDYPLLHMDHVTLTPHAAYNSYEATTELYRRVAETAVVILQGNMPDNAVNKKALARG